MPVGQASGGEPRSTVERATDQLHRCTHSPPDVAGADVCELGFDGYRWLIGLACAPSRSMGQQQRKEEQGGGGTCRQAAATGHGGRSLRSQLRTRRSL